MFFWLFMKPFNMLHVNMYDCSSVVLERIYVGMDDLGEMCVCAYTCVCLCSHTYIYYQA